MCWANTALLSFSLQSLRSSTTPENSEPLRVQPKHLLPTQVSSPSYIRFQVSCSFCSIQHFLPSPFQQLSAFPNGLFMSWLSFFSAQNFSPICVSLKKPGAAQVHQVHASCCLSSQICRFSARTGLAELLQTPLVISNARHREGISLTNISD